MQQVLQRMTMLICRGPALMLACALSGCDFPGQPNPADRPVPDDQIVAFEHLFQQNCAGCHGVEGKFGPAPPLHDPIFLSIVPDAELLRVITEGRPGTPMTAFAKKHGGPLNEAQVNVLATGLKSRWKAPVELKVSLPPYLAPARDASDVSTTRLEVAAKLFARACAACHGEHGRGTSVVGAIHEPAFLGLISDQALRRIIITGRPDLGMPNFASNFARGADYQPLSSAEIDELVALLGAWRKGSSPTEPIAKSEPKSQPSTDSEERKP